MALTEVLDGIRRVIHKWVNTVSPLISDVSVGSDEVEIRSTRRFEIGDEVMLKDPTVYETGLTIDSIVDANIIKFTTPVLNNWTVDQNTQLIKTIHEHFVQGIYIGEPEVIPRYPAITVNGISRASEWMTLESTKERYEIEVGVFIKESTHEAGYRFLLALTDIIQKGLKRNIIPLVHDYDLISLGQDIALGDVNILLTDADKVENYRRIIIEDDYESQENWIDVIYSSISEPSGGLTPVHLSSPVCADFKVNETTIVVPKRFVFNSWPANIDYGKIHKGALLKAAIIRWFAEEEEMQYLRRTEQQLK